MLNTLYCSVLSSRVNAEMVFLKSYFCISRLFLSSEYHEPSHVLSNSKTVMKKKVET